jgi:hypothetical protein
VSKSPLLLIFGRIRSVTQKSDRHFKSVGDLVGPTIGSISGLANSELDIIASKQMTIDCEIESNVVLMEVEQLRGKSLICVAQVTCPYLEQNTQQSSIFRIIFTRVSSFLKWLNMKHRVSSSIFLLLM